MSKHLQRYNLESLLELCVRKPNHSFFRTGPTTPNSGEKKLAIIQLRDVVLEVTFVFTNFRPIRLLDYFRKFRD